MAKVIYFIFLCFAFISCQPGGNFLGSANSNNKTQRPSSVPSPSKIESSIPNDNDSTASNTATQTLTQKNQNCMDTNLRVNLLNKYEAKDIYSDSASQAVNFEVEIKGCKNLDANSVVLEIYQAATSIKLSIPYRIDFNDSQINSKNGATEFLKEQPTTRSFFHGITEEISLPDPAKAVFSFDLSNRDLHTGGVFDPNGGTIGFRAILKFGSKQSVSLWFCVPYSKPSSEECVVPSEDSGFWGDDF